MFDSWNLDRDRSDHLGRVLDCNVEQHEWEGEWPWCIHCHKDKQFLEMIQEVISLGGLVLGDTHCFCTAE
jgi:hypothetical protein